MKLPLVPLKDLSFWSSEITFRIYQILLHPCLNKLNRRSSRGQGISVRFVFHFQPLSLNAFHEFKEWWCPMDGEDTQRGGIALWALWEWMPSLRKTHFGQSCEQEINVYCVKRTELWQVCAVWVNFRTHSTETFHLAFPSIVALTSWVSEPLQGFCQRPFKNIVILCKNNNWATCSIGFGHGLHFTTWWQEPHSLRVHWFCG